MARHHRIPLLAVVVGVMLTGCGPIASGGRLEAKATATAAYELTGDVDRLIEELDVDVEQLSRRVNRCEQDGDDVYYIWIGMRAVHMEPDAAIERQHSRWDAADWAITRYRHLDDGGVNLAGTDPATGHAYALDSGFEAGDEYIVGTFGTPCFRDPSGSVDFGPLN